MSLAEVTVSKPLTRGDITFLVDYNDGAAVDPPTGVVFTSQSEVDAFLTQQSATNFKHVQLCFDALPFIIDHTITFELAAGVHRPIPTPSSAGSFNFAGRKFGSAGSLAFNGATSTSYTTLVGSQSITGRQLGSGDPWMDFAGTPFAGLDLRGTYAVISTGQVALIHDHTDSRLFVNQGLSPDPTGGSVIVAQPSTVLRNSLDDSATLGSVTLNFDLERRLPPAVTVDDVIVDPFGGSAYAVGLQNGTAVTFNRVIVDQLSMIAAFGKTPNGNGWQAQNGSRLTLNACSHRGVKPATGGADRPIILTGGSALSFFVGYVGGGEDPLYSLDGDFQSIYGVVFDQVGVGSQSSVWVQGGLGSLFFGHSTFFSEKKNEIRSAAGIGLRMTNGAVGASPQNLTFSNCTGPCVRLESGATLDVPQSYLDLGGNVDVGFDIVGPASRLTITTATDVTGTAGDVRIGGTIVPYADITTTGPVVTLDFSSVTR